MPESGWPTAGPAGGGRAVPRRPSVAPEMSLFPWRRRQVSDGRLDTPAEDSPTTHPPVHMYSRRRGSGGKPCSVSQAPAPPALPGAGDGTHACSCVNAAVDVRERREARLEGHGVRGEDGVVPRRTRAPRVGVTGRVLLEGLAEVQVLLREGERPLLLLLVFQTYFY